MAWIPVAEALERVMATVVAGDAESVPLLDAAGRIAAEHVVSPRDVPPWDNSAMDGYAVIAEDTRGGSATLRLQGIVGAGHVADAPVQRGSATAVMTGAPMPDGADAVVVVEDTNGATEGWVDIRIEANVGQHIRRRGDDIERGQQVVSRGDVLTPARLGLLASLGLPAVRVVRRPRVAILPTGTELVAPGQPLPAGAIYSSNDVALAALVRATGGIADVRPATGDHLESLVEALEACLDADIVVTTGGVSVGKFDYVKEAFGRVGIPMGFWKVQMKPGKPLAFGVATPDTRSVPVFGLPGNPVSCMVNFYQFVRPWIRASLGMPEPYLPVVDVTAGEPIRSRPGRVRFVRVVLSRDGSGWVARRTGSQSSGVLTSMAKAHGLLMIAADEQGPEAGERARVQLLDTTFLDGQVPAFGW